MNDCCPTDSLAATIPPKSTPAPRGLLSWVMNNPIMVSVDLMDSFLATMPRRDGAPYEAVIRPNCSE